MFPFWEIVIAPLIETIAPTRVVEIGALRGDTTARLLESLGGEAELHVIDPAPQFDPAEHERRFPGRYVFHQAASLDVLAELPAFDLALIDGDHNWYTVYNELRLLQSTASDARQPAPVFVLHDVSWPYGRRDGYYAPDRVPQEFRQPCAQRGMQRAFAGLLPEGGMNQHIFNTEREGGSRNGVLTALEDFCAEQRPPFEHVVIDVYSGLAIATDPRRLTAGSAFTTMMQELRSDRVQRELRVRAEKVARETFASEHKGS